MINITKSKEAFKKFLDTYEDKRNTSFKLKVVHTNERSLLHSKIIRDVDKLDNYRVKKDESIEAIFPTRVKSIEDMENATLSDKVFETIQNKQCVDIHDRVTPLDFWSLHISIYV